MRSEDADLHAARHSLRATRAKSHAAMVATITTAAEEANEVKQIAMM